MREKCEMQFKGTPDRGGTSRSRFKSGACAYLGSDSGTKVTAPGPVGKSQRRLDTRRPHENPLALTFV